ncbi:hypothetical protein B0H11DRAFT_2341799 [Mycena galericulata]|nr:hypothetical protein B0H11DRAFT_2341799 [Mycena galericulata]
MGGYVDISSTWFCAQYTNDNAIHSLMSLSAGWIDRLIQNAAAGVLRRGQLELIEQHMLQSGQLLLIRVTRVLHVRRVSRRAATYELCPMTGYNARVPPAARAAVVDSGITAGDTDIIGPTPLTNATLAGKPIDVNIFTFARVYAAGHEVPAAALAILEQIIAGEPLHFV